MVEIDRKRQISEAKKKKKLKFAEGEEGAVEEESAQERKVQVLMEAKEEKEKPSLAKILFRHPEVFNLTNFLANRKRNLKMYSDLSEKPDLKKNTSQEKILLFKRVREASIW